MLIVVLAFFLLWKALEAIYLHDANLHDVNLYDALGSLALVVVLAAMAKMNLQLKGEMGDEEYEL